MGEDTIYIFDFDVYDKDDNTDFSVYDLNFMFVKKEQWNQRKKKA